LQDFQEHYVNKNMLDSGGRGIERRIEIIIYRWTSQLLSFTKTY